MSWRVPLLHCGIVGDGGSPVKHRDDEIDDLYGRSEALDFDRAGIGVEGCEELEHNDVDDIYDDDICCDDEDDDNENVAVQEH